MYLTILRDSAAKNSVTEPDSENGRHSPPHSRVEYPTTQPPRVKRSREPRGGGMLRFSTPFSEIDVVFGPGNRGERIFD